MVTGFLFIFGLNKYSFLVLNSKKEGYW